MAFYNNRMIIVNTDDKGIYVFKNIKEKIIMDHYNNHENKLGEIIEKDLLDGFDVMIQESGEIYLLYQNLEYYLKIIKISGENRESYNLTDEKIDKVFHINIFKFNNYTNIIYLIRGQKQDTYSIKHHILKKEKWISFNVDDILVDKILNPIKIILNETSFQLLYYSENNISMKRYNAEDNLWEESIELTDNKRKLYMDTIIDNKYLHLVYCEFTHERLEIKYIRYDNKKDILEKDILHNISDGINPTNPTLLIYDKKMWIVWNESLNLFSRYSEDQGNTWSPIYLWKDARKMNIVRYKYINNRDDLNMKFDYTFGTIGEDINFLGFGPLDNVEEISKKKIEIENLSLSKEKCEISMDIDSDIGEEEVLNIIKGKLEIIEEFLRNNTRGNYIKYLKNKDIE